MTLGELARELGTTANDLGTFANYVGHDEKTKISKREAAIIKEAWEGTDPVDGVYRSSCHCDADECPKSHRNGDGERYED